MSLARPRLSACEFIKPVYPILNGDHSTVNGLVMAHPMAGVAGPTLRNLVNRALHNGTISNLSNLQRQSFKGIASSTPNTFNYGRCIRVVTANTANRMEFGTDWQFGRLQPFSIELRWFIGLTSGSWQLVGNRDLTNGTGFDVTMNEDSAGAATGFFMRMRLQATGGGAIDVATTAAAATQARMNHLIVTYDGSGTAAGLTLYRDGVAQALTVVSDNLTGNPTSTIPYSIFGRQGATVAASVDARVMHHRLWNRALTAAEVRDAYRNPYGWLLQFNQLTFIPNAITDISGTISGNGAITGNIGQSIDGSGLALGLGDLTADGINIQGLDGTIQGTGDITGDIGLQNGSLQGLIFAAGRIEAEGQRISGSLKGTFKIDKEYDD